MKTAPRRKRGKPRRKAHHGKEVSQGQISRAASRRNKGSSAARTEEQQGEAQILGWEGKPRRSSRRARKGGTQSGTIRRDSPGKQEEKSMDQPGWKPWRRSIRPHSNASWKVESNRRGSRLQPRSSPRRGRAPSTTPPSQEGREWLPEDVNETTASGRARARMIGGCPTWPASAWR